MAVAGIRLGRGEEAVTSGTQTSMSDCGQRAIVYEYEMWSPLVSQWEVYNVGRSGPHASAFHCTYKENHMVDIEIQCCKCLEEERGCNNLFSFALEKN